MPSPRWPRTPLRLPLRLFAITLIPVLALVWLTRQLIEKDRQLELQQSQERVEHAADRIVAAAHQRLEELQSQLHRLVDPSTDLLPAHTTLVIVEHDQVKVARPAGLPFLPVLRQHDALPRDMFAGGERLEYQDGDPSQAIAWFSKAARSADVSVRAGALLRLGRNQRKAGLIDEALTTFAALEALGVTQVDGLPSALLALQARGAIFDAAGRTADLLATAESMHAGLVSGAWPITRDVHDYYLEQARRWARPFPESEETLNARAAAAVVKSTYEEWIETGNVPQRQWVVAERRPVLMATSGDRTRLILLLAGVEFLQRAWSGVSGAQVQLTDPAGHTIVGTGPIGSEPRAVRTPDASQLPWTLRVTSTTLETDRAAAAAKRRLLLTVAVMVLAVLVGSAYFSVRAVSRELAVARLQSDFVSAVSHEFRTPLASVRHLSDLLAKGRVADEAGRQQCYDFLSRESERLESLVEELLDFGKLENGAYRYHFEPVDIASLVRDLVDRFQQRAAPATHRIDLSVDVRETKVRADKEALSRAILNLLDNAVKYSPGADVISVTLRHEADSLVISVRDRGLGIALHEQQEIFRKFVRGTNARVEQIKGTGIGLAMVRHIMDAHRGEVRVESQPNEGSTFALRLPVEKHA